MLASFSEFERATIAERSRDGLRRVFKEGRHLGRIPYGYDVNADGAFEIVEDEARVVRRILANMAAGATLYSSRGANEGELTLGACPEDLEQRGAWYVRGAQQRRHTQLGLEEGPQSSSLALRGARHGSTSVPCRYRPPRSFGSLFPEYSKSLAAVLRMSANEEAVNRLGRECNNK